MSRLVSSSGLVSISTRRIPSISPPYIQTDRDILEYFGIMIRPRSKDPTGYSYILASNLLIAFFRPECHIHKICHEYSLFQSLLGYDVMALQIIPDARVVARLPIKAQFHW